MSVAHTVPERLHRLDDLRVPDVPGRSRIAGPADHHLLLRWHLAFAADVSHPPGAIEGGMRVRLSRHALLLWTIDGEAVSMAGHTGVVAGVTRVGPVYTPPRRRRRGYGAAATAAASAAAHAQPGARHVTLFTDLRNPTSNKIYAQIGYLPVRDSLEVSFVQHQAS